MTKQAPPPCTHVKSATQGSYMRHMHEALIAEGDQRCTEPATHAVVLTRSPLCAAHASVYKACLFQSVTSSFAPGNRALRVETEAREIYREWARGSVVALERLEEAIRGANKIEQS